MFQHGATIATFIKELARDDAGQDLIEYALLTALVAAGSVLLFNQIAVTMNTAYAGPSGWNQSAQAVWEPCAPIGGACP